MTYDVKDSELVALYHKGDNSAFEELMLRHKNKVFTTIYLIVKDRYVAEDLMQDAFTKVINTIKSGKYNEQGKFLPWVLRIAHNLAIDNFRKDKRYPTIVMEDGGYLMDKLNFSDDNAEGAMEYTEVKQKLRKLVQKLPQEQKEVLIMRHYMDMSFKEIADTTQVSINTALGRMRYALINLRKMIEESQIDLRIKF